LEHLSDGDGAASASLSSGNRIKRQVERLLDDAETAVVAKDWKRVREASESVLAIEPENAEARSYLLLAGRNQAPPNGPLAETRESTAATRPGGRSIALRPMHFILASFLLGLLIAGGAILAFSAGRGDQTEQTSVEAPVLPTPTGLDESPTQVPSATSVPTSIPVAPTAIPIVRSCAEIRAAGDYLNPEERAFFLANCVTQAGTGPGPGPAQPTSGAGATAEEESYRRRASGFMLASAARFVQYFGQPSFGFEQDLLELGSIAGGWANQMNTLAPVPPRFRQAHDQLRAALYEFGDWCQAISFVDTLDKFYAWEAYYYVLEDALVAAWDDYELVIGISLPSAPR
jgi:hypothetical protein